MLTHRGFSAWIAVDDQPLPEYLTAVDEAANRVSCWVPGEEGQTFQVWWQDHGGKVETCSFIVLDGLAVPGRFLMGEGNCDEEWDQSFSYDGEAFHVCENAGEDVCSEEGEEPNTEAGTIMLKIKRVKRSAPHRCNPVHDVNDIAALGKKKVGDLCIGFGQERATTLQSPTTWSVEPYDTPGSSKPSTYVSFVFRYRSAEFLESQGIAPEVKKRVAPKVGDKRRISSISENDPLATSGPSEPKRPRLSGPGAPSVPPKSRPPSRAPSKNHTVDQSHAPRRPANSRKPSAMQRTASGRDLIKEAQAQGAFTFFPPGTPNYLPSLLLTPQYQNPHLLTSSQSSRTESSSGASALSPLSNAFSDFDEDEYNELFQ
ncbi:hypothetical protein BKA70DRAFT_1416413 [Coprinopsis sp. MPI-PUGE-AT-0042]|nr:hypothetical protein BKA70DRAFT_1416413 [Coprinopsis sp. MPI-PUGE-AT-0042]